MKQVRSFGNHRGVSTLEILIAFAILTLAISAVIMVVFGNQSIAIDTQNNIEAISKSQALLEEARADANDNFYSVLDQSNTLEMSGPLAYTKSLTVDDPDVFTKVVTSTVTWKTGVRDLVASFTTILTNPEAVLSGDTCNPTTSGDWTSPQLLGSADYGQNNGATDIEVVNGKAYTTADASDVNKPDFYIIDVSDPKAADLPEYSGALNTGPGLVAVQVSGHYAYVANMSTVNQLQIIDVSEPSAPVWETSANRDVVTLPADTAVGNSIFYADKKVYLGLAKSLGPEFYVFDVSTPTNPVLKASYEVNSQVNTILVRDGIAYLAVADDPVTAGVIEQVKILDVSQANSGTISPINFFGPNAKTMSGQGLYLSKDAKTLYVGMQGLNAANKPEFYVVNAATLAVQKSKFINASVRAISIRKNLAFLWTSDTNKEFQVLDLNNLSAGVYGSRNMQASPTGGFDCEGDYIFTAQTSNFALQVVGPTITKATPTISGVIYNNATNASVTTVTKGTSVYDKVTVSGSVGTPTGTATFTVYKSKNDCSGPTQTESVTLSSGAAQSSVYQTDTGPAPKSISYKVQYGGDAKYAAAIGSCQPLTVN